MGRGPPPPPMATQGPNSAPYMGGRPGNNNSMNMGRSSIPNMNDGINIRENQSNPVNIERTPRRPPQQQSSSQRPEMKGPSDISEILSGLKTKTINIQEPPQQQQQQKFQPQQQPDVDSISLNNDSTISISDLKELQGSGSGNMPKKSGRRKPRSDKNTISLDI
jgi:hypothetical protein